MQKVYVFILKFHFIHVLHDSLGVSRDTDTFYWLTITINMKTAFEKFRFSVEMKIPCKQLNGMQLNSIFSWLRISEKPIYVTKTEIILIWKKMRRIS